MSHATARRVHERRLAVMVTSRCGARHRVPFWIESFAVESFECANRWK